MLREVHTPTMQPISEPSRPKGSPNEEADHHPHPGCDRHRGGQEKVATKPEFAATESHDEPAPAGSLARPAVAASPRLPLDGRRAACVRSRSASPRTSSCRRRASRVPREEGHLRAHRTLVRQGRIRHLGVHRRLRGRPRPRSARRGHAPGRARRRSRGRSPRDLRARRRSGRWASPTGSRRVPRRPPRRSTGSWSRSPRGSGSSRGAVPSSRRCAPPGRRGGRGARRRAPGEPGADARRLRHRVASGEPRGGRGRRRRPSSSCAAATSPSAARCTARCWRRPPRPSCSRSPGARLSANDVGEVFDLPVLARVPVKSVIARAVDAGVLATRLPEPLARSANDLLRRLDPRSGRNGAAA